MQLSNDDTDTYPRELRECLTYLYAQLRSGIPANCMGAFIVAALVWGHTPHVPLLCWVAIVILVTAYRWNARKQQPDMEQASLEDLERAWSRLRLGIIASGLAWGSSSLLAYPSESALHQGAFVIVVAGLTAGAVPMLAVRFAPYAINCLCVLLPLAARLISEGDSAHMVLGATTVILAGMMLRSAQDFSRLFKESAHLRARLERQASIDPLTCLANRREFERVFDREWRAGAREGTPVSVLALDADHFKIYNDHYGHVQGDDCLRQIGRCLSNSLHRPKDLAARIGGEEFVVLLPGIGSEGALEVATRIRDAVRTAAIPHELSPLSDTVTLSIGTASTIPSADTTSQELLERADRALYQAKETGRDRVCSWGTPRITSIGGRRSRVRAT